MKKLLTIAVGAGLVLVAVYLLATGVKVASGVSAMEPVPSHRVRLQVLAGTGEKDDARRAASFIREQAGGTLDVDIVEVDEYDLRTIARSLLVSRVDDRAGAEELARRIGMKPSEVTYRPLEHNNKHVTATLIVGPDFEEIVSSFQQAKELQRQS